MVQAKLNNLAPELAVSEWFNTDKPITLAGLRGRVVLLHAFQLLCPGCVSDALPQIRKVEHFFRRSELQVIGLHSVFEHHAAMTPVTLKAFIQEYRLTSPIGVDLADGTSPLPVTMRRYAFQGTPSTVLIGRDGKILHQSFGVEDDMVVGARIASALSMPIPEVAAPQPTAETCADGVCAAPVA